MLLLLRELHANMNSEKAKKEACRLFPAHSNQLIYWVPAIVLFLFL